MVTTDEAAFLAAICANRADDVVRGAYADWLDEHDQPERAEFIRVGCERPGTIYADNVPHRIDDRGPGRLLDRWVTVPGPSRTPGCQRLIRAILPPPEKTSRFNAVFTRGFLDEIECPASWWLAHGDDILTRHPVETVRLTTWPEVETAQRMMMNANRTIAYGTYAAGWRLVGDPKADWYLTYAEADRRLTPDRSTPQVVCEARWPGVRFEIRPEPTVVERLGALQLARSVVSPPPSGGPAVP